MADRRRIVQVLNNLFANAAWHAPESSPIRVPAAREDTHVAVSVSDEGPGVAPEIATSVPQARRRRRGATARHGLGLAICKGLVEAHGGHIRAESDGPGRGATFTFTVPVAGEPGAAVAGHAAGPPPAADRHGPPRILVVDDDPKMLRFVRNALSAAGYATLVTGEPEKSGAHHPDREARNWSCSGLRAGVLATCPSANAARFAAGRAPRVGRTAAVPRRTGSAAASPLGRTPSLVVSGGPVRSPRGRCHTARGLCARWFAHVGQRATVRSISSFVGSTTSTTRVSVDRHMSIVRGTAGSARRARRRQLEVRLRSHLAASRRTGQDDRLRLSRLDDLLARATLPLPHTEAVVCDSATRRRALFAELPPFALGPR